MAEILIGKSRAGNFKIVTYGIWISSLHFMLGLHQIKDLEFKKIIGIYLLCHSLPFFLHIPLPWLSFPDKLLHRPLFRKYY